jgi:hypothetical protein
MANTQSAPLSSDEVTETTTTGPLSRGGVSVEMGKPKAGTLGVSGKVNLGPDQTAEILRNMQAELDKRSGPMNTFLSGLQRASAWGSGGAQGPAAALTAMDREQLLKDQDTRALMQQMASVKSAQASREGKMQSYGALPGQFSQAGVAPQAGAAPQAGGTAIEQMISSLPLAQQPIAKRAWNSGDADTVESMVIANEKNRTSEAKNLELLKGLPPGPERDMVQNQLYEKAMANRSYIGPEGEIKYTPAYAMPPSMRGGAPAAAAQPSAGLPNLKQIALDAGIPADAIISEYRDPAKQLSLIDREDPNKPGRYLTKEGRPVALPGRSAHQIPGAAIDLKPGYELTPVQKQALRQAGAVQVAGSPNHYELPISKINAALAVDATTPKTDKIGQFSTRAEEGKQLSIAGIKADNESIIKELQNPMLAQLKAEKELDGQIERTISILDNTKTGPGASTAQLATEIKGFFKELSPKELENLVNQKTISQTQATIVASGIKSAFGGQLSDKEGDRFIKTLFTIDDPKTFIKATLEMRRVAIQANKDFVKYLVGKPDKAAALLDYQTKERDVHDKLIKQYAPTVYAKMQQSPAAAAAPTSKTSNAAAEAWLKANPNDPDAPAVRAILGIK